MLQCLETRTSLNAETVGSRTESAGSTQPTRIKTSSVTPLKERQQQQRRPGDMPHLRFNMYPLRYLRSGSHLPIKKSELILVIFL